MKAAAEYRSMTEERKQNRFKIGDHVYLEHLGIVSEIKHGRRSSGKQDRRRRSPEGYP